MIEQELKGFINVMVDCILSFYDIAFKGKGRQKDLKRDLVENMMTNIVLRDQVYIIVFKLHTDLLQEQIQKLDSVQRNKEILNSKLNFDVLNIKPEFRMDQDVRNQYDVK